MKIAYRIYLLVVTYATVAPTSGLSRERRDDANPIIVTTIKEEPYVIDKNPRSTGKDRFEGLIPDMMKHIGDVLKLDYNFKIVNDGKYGSLDESGKWTGMIRELLDQAADMAAAPMTISEQRKGVVDFTEPFENFGTVLLMLKDDDRTIESVEDLANQDEISYGIIKDGVTENFFETSQNPNYKKMWQKMQGNLMDTVAEGVQRVRDGDGKFAFILEKATADYWADKAPCNLDIVGPRINQNSFAFALKKGDENLEKINEEIKKMHASGMMLSLIRKWKKGECNRVIDDDTSNAPTHSQHAIGLAVPLVLAAML